MDGDDFFSSPYVALTFESGGQYFKNTLQVLWLPLSLYVLMGLHVNFTKKELDHELDHDYRS